MKNLKKILLAGLTVTTTLLFAFTTGNTWQNDKAHSQLVFTVTHLGLSDVSGTFNDFDTKIHATKSDFSDATITLSAKTASLDTRIEARNNHLKSADFFNVAQYPELTFKSTGIAPAGKNTYKVTGDLTLNGVTKKVTVEAQFRGIGENPMSKKTTAGFHVSGVIKRSDFNFGSKFPAPMISDEVKIAADGEFTQE